MTNEFPCDQCGLCCKQVGASDIYKHLDRGDGVCKSFNDKTNTCDIYSSRPDICRVDVMYHKYYMEKCSKTEFYQLNLIACQQLKTSLN